MMSTNSSLSDRPELIVSLQSEVIDESHALLLRGNENDWQKETSRALYTHFEVYIFADKYEITPLKGLALRKFQVGLKRLASKPRIAVMYAACYIEKYYRSNTRSKNDGMKRLLVSFSFRHYRKFMTYPEFRRVIKDNGEFAHDFIEAIMGLH